MKKKIVFCWLMIAFSYPLSLALPVQAYASPSSVKIKMLRDSVKALHRICENALSNLAKAHVTGSMSQRDQYEYKMYIQYLEGRIDKYCSQLSGLGGQKAVEGLPCSSMAFPLSVKTGPRAKTQDEQIADLDQTLIASLGKFDEMLLKEDENLKEKTSGQNKSGDTSSGQGGYNPGTGKTGKGKNGATGKNGQGNGSAGDREQGKNPGLSGESGDFNHKKGATAAGEISTASGRKGRPGITSPSLSRAERDRLAADDDIVARQLREAAEKETDPELKKKLWEEYRKYKEGR